MRRSLTIPSSLNYSKTISKQIFEEWNKFILKRQNELPEHLICSKEIEDQLQDSWERISDRSTKMIDGKKLIDYHKKVADIYKFKFPFHPKLLAEMIHPHFGYLNNIEVNLRRALVLINIMIFRKLCWSQLMNLMKGIQF